MEKKFIEQKEGIFNGFFGYLKGDDKNVNKFMRSRIEEKWGIISKGKDNESIKNYYKKLIYEDKKEITNNLIKIQAVAKYFGSDTSILLNIFKL